MKKIFLLIFIMSYSYLVAQNYGLGNTDSNIFTKFSIPETKYSIFNINGNFSFSSQNEERNYFSNNVTNTKTTIDDINYTFNLAPKYFYEIENDNFLLRINTGLSARTFINENDAIWDYKDYSDAHSSTSHSTSFTPYFNFNYKTYDEEGALYVNYGGYFSYTFNEWNYESKSKNNNIENNYNNYSKSNAQNYHGKIGVGVGKLRNITPVVTAIRFQERLKKLNLINSDLSESDLLAFSEKFSRENIYEQYYDRAEKYLWKDIDELLEKNNVDLGELNYFSAAYLFEVLNEIKFVRYEGYNLGVDFKLEYDKYRYTGNSWSRFTEYRFDDLQNKYLELLVPQLSIYFNYSHQVNLYSQLGINLELSGGTNTIKNPIVKQIYSANLSVNYNYELTDKLLVSLSEKITYENINREKIIKNLYNSLALSLIYFVEDNVSLNVNYYWNYSFRNDFFNQPEEIFSINDINIGFNYYLDTALFY